MTDEEPIPRPFVDRGWLTVTADAPDGSPAHIRVSAVQAVTQFDYGSLIWFGDRYVIAMSPPRDVMEAILAAERGS